MTAGDRLLGTRSLDGRRDCAPRMRDAEDIHAGANDNALALQAIEYHVDTFGIAARERPRRLEHVTHFPANERLRELRPTLPAPTMMRCAGLSFRSKILSLVRKRPPSGPQ